MSGVSEHTEPDDEAFWDEAIAHADLQVGDLEAAEERLQDGDDAPLPQGMAETLVRHATHPAPTRGLQESGVGKLRQWMRAAVILMGSSTMLTAGTMGTLVVVYLVWSAGQKSRETMTDEMAIELLWQTDQPERARMSATLKVAQRAEEGIVALRSLRVDPTTPQPLAAGVIAGLGRLRELVEIQPPQRLPGRFQDISEAALASKDAAQPVVARAQQLERLIISIGTAVGELRCMPAQTNDLAQTRTSMVNRLRYQLTR